MVKRKVIMQSTWTTKAQLYEVLSIAFGYTNPGTIDALADEAFAAALHGFCEQETSTLDYKKDIEPFLSQCLTEDRDALFHRIRIEYTRLFVGSPRALVSPYAGIWYALDKGLDPLLFVGKESMAVERFMRSCGITRPEGMNEPLDDISAELEFLNYLALNEAGAIELPKGVSIPETAYSEFYTKHFSEWTKRFADAVIEESSEPLFRIAASVLKALPAQPW